MPSVYCLRLVAFAMQQNHLSLSNNQVEDHRFGRSFTQWEFLKSISCLQLIESYIKILWLKSFIRKYFATFYLKEMGAPLQKVRIWQNLFSHRQRSRLILAPFNNSLINIFTRWFWCVHVNMQMTLKIVRLSEPNWYTITENEYHTPYKWALWK